MTGAKRLPPPGEVLKAWPVLIIFVLAAMLFLGGPYMTIGGVRSLSKARAIPGGEDTTGEIVDSRSSTSTGSRTGSRTITQDKVRFTTDDGETVEFWGSSDTEASIGDEVPVSYSPDDPRGAHQIGGNTGGWGLLLVGLAMTAIDVWIVVALVRRRRRRRA